MTTVLPNGEIQSNPKIAYNKGYEKGRADKEKELLERIEELESRVSELESACSALINGYA